MSANSPEPVRAKQRKARRLNLVWLVPFLALAVTAVLLWNNTLNKGPQIELYMSSAEGIEEGKTLVKLRSVTVGRVTAVKLTDNYSKAAVTIQMAADTDDLLHSDTVFWLVKPRVENTGISGLNTLLSGSYFEMSVGSSDEMSRSFTALDEPPAVRSGMNGQVLTLTSDARKRLKNGDYVNYRGFAAGRVISSSLDFETNRIVYQIFIEDPYTKLINANTKFWISSGIDLSITGEGLQLTTDSIDNILRGGVAFDNLNDDKTARPLDLKHPQILYPDYAAARLEALRSGLLYVVMLKNDLKNIAPGSGIYYHSVKIGEVIAAPYFASLRDLFQDSSYIPVLASINLPQGDDRAYVRDLFAQKLADHSLCAQAAAANILTGDNRLQLQLTGGKCSYDIKSYRGMAVIPAQETESLQDKVDAVIARLDEIDLQGISDELKKALSSTSEAMQSFARSNDKVEQTQLLEKMVTSFESFTRATKSYAAGSDIHQKLSEALSLLTQAMQDLKPAMAQLGQDPSSMLYGSSAQDPLPKAVPQNKAAGGNNDE